MTSGRFAPELHSELALALHAFDSTKGAPPEDQRLTAAMDYVCSEAHRLGMSPEAMVIGITAAYDAVAAGNKADEFRLRTAYDRLLYGCIQAYFTQQQRQKS